MTRHESLMRGGRTGKVDPSACVVSFIVSVLIGLSPPASSAGYNVWSAEGGPFGGRVQALLSSSAAPHLILAGVERGGVFLSYGDGTGWIQKDAGLGLTDILSLEVHPTYGNVFFAGTGGGGVYTSSDAAESWTSASQGLTSLTVNALCYATNSSGFLYAATSGGGVFRSGNDGQNWVPMNSGLSTLSVRALAIAPPSLPT